VNPVSTPASPLFGSHVTRSPEETEALAARLAAALRPGDRVALCGPLGGGKTTFVRGLARGLGLDPTDVHSPTFTRVHRYRGRITLVHADLYRVDTAEGYAELGLDDDEAASGDVAATAGAPAGAKARPNSTLQPHAGDGPGLGTPPVIVLEWADRLPPGTPPPRFRVDFELGVGENDRRIRISVLH